MFFYHADSDFIISPDMLTSQYKMACTPSLDEDPGLTSDLVNRDISLWEPTYDYDTDSVFGVAVPVVSQESKRVRHYEASVRVATH